MTEEQREYFNSNRKIPFTTHKDIMILDMVYIEALAFMTYMSSITDFNTISEIGGFEGCNAEIEDNNLYSYKIKKRSELNIINCAKYFGKGRNTITRFLNRLEHLSKYSDIDDILTVEYENDDTVYRINHKAHEKYYTLIDTNTLKKLIQLNGTAIKLYLVIKYNYEYFKDKGKPCVLDMEYLARKVGLNSVSQVSKTLAKMDNVVIKRKMKYKINTNTNDLNKKNTPKSIYEYEVIQA